MACVYLDYSTRFLHSFAVRYVFSSFILLSLNSSMGRHVINFFFQLYILFPLLLLLDAAIDSRSSPNVDSNEGFIIPNALSDIVMEGAFHTSEEVLFRVCGSASEV